MRFLVAITTGRTIAQHTVAALARHFQRYGHGRWEITLLLNYDLSFDNQTPEAFSIPAPIARAFERVLYLGPHTEEQVRAAFVSSGLTPYEAALLSQPAGYGCRKNIVLLLALREQFDCVLFWDDDEYPVVCGGGPDNPVWYSTDVLGGHRAAIALGADVSFGFWSGFISPVPQDLSSVLSSGVLAALGEALSIATESFTPDSFRSPHRSVAFVDVPPPAGRIASTSGGKWVSGGNLGISVAAVRGGRVPLFYTPPGSRADDTLLSLRLQTAEVWRVPSGIFHDCFGLYTDVASGASPKVNQKVSLLESRVQRRFAAALEAWLASAPLFMRITEPHEFGLASRRLLDLLQAVDRGLATECPELARQVPGGSLASRFTFYLNGLEERLDDLRTIERLWAEVVGWASEAVCPLYEETAR